MYKKSLARGIVYYLDWFQQKKKNKNTPFRSIIGARGRTRTDMAVNRWILSPLRLPISPLGHGQNYIRTLFINKELFIRRRWKRQLRIVQRNKGRCKSRTPSWSTYQNMIYIEVSQKP